MTKNLLEAETSGGIEKKKLQGEACLVAWSKIL